MIKSQQLVIVGATLCLLLSMASCRPCHHSPPHRRSPIAHRPPPPLRPPPAPPALGLCLANNATGTSQCPFDAGSQSSTSLWRDCIHDVGGRCGRVSSTANSSATPNDNSGCRNCVLWACVQNPQLPLVIGGVPFDFTLNTSCRANGVTWYPPAAGLPAYGVLMGPIDTYNNDHFLVIPSTPVWGVDDPTKDASEFLWDKAWQLRALTQVPLSQWAVAINSRRSRGQQQMHIHTAAMVSGNRARIDAITASTQSIQLLTEDGRNITARVAALNATATNPVALQPFTSLPVNPAPPLTADNPNADRGLLIAAGPGSVGLVMLDVGIEPVDGPDGVLFNT